MVEDRHELAEEVSEIADTQPNPDELTAELENTEKDRFDCSEIETDVEEPKAKITLEAAVEYEAFLRQTIEPKIEEYPIFKQSDNGSIEQYDVALNIDTESASSTELVDCVNTLIPLIVELLKYKIDNSQESIFEAVAPTVERLIERRASEEPEKMAAAISSILPAAITEKINLNPKTIAKAIGQITTWKFGSIVDIKKHGVALITALSLTKWAKTYQKEENVAIKSHMALYFL